MNASDKIREISGVIKEIGGSRDPLREAWAVVSEVLRMDKALLMRDDPELGGQELKKLDDAVNGLREHKPLQYITGRAEFYGLTFKVGPGVLVPRPETELLADEALKLLSARGAGMRVLDLCTGSGCLAVVLAKRLGGAEVTGTDTSEVALQYARQNARTNKAENVRFLKGALFGPVRGESFDLIISNPPYIRSADIKGLEPRVRDWEPRGALDGGEDGTDLLVQIIQAAPGHLNDAGVTILEIGPGQGESLAEAASKAGLSDVRIIRDLAGHDRVLIAEKR